MSVEFQKFRNWHQLQLLYLLDYKCHNISSPLHPLVCTTGKTTLLTLIHLLSLPVLRSVGQSSVSVLKPWSGLVRSRVWTLVSRNGTGCGSASRTQILDLDLVPWPWSSYQLTFGGTRCPAPAEISSQPQFLYVSCVLSWHEMDSRFNQLNSSFTNTLLAHSLILY